MNEYTHGLASNQHVRVLWRDQLEGQVDDKAYFEGKKIIILRLQQIILKNVIFNNNDVKLKGIFFFFVFSKCICNLSSFLFLFTSMLCFVLFFLSPLLPSSLPLLQLNIIEVSRYRRVSIKNYQTQSILITRRICVYMPIFF